jgi:hypothetical protein
MADSAGDAEQAGRGDVPEGHLPVSEFAAAIQGGPSPFGEDVQFPLPTDDILYLHPTEDDRPRLAPSRE